MRAPLYQVSDYVQAFMQLLPSGPGWDEAKLPGSNLSAVVAALMPTYYRSNLSATNLLVDAFPSTTVDLLLAWQNSLNLPDACLGPSPTLSAEQQQVVARFASGGSLSIPFMIAFAANLGFPITITEYTGAQAYHYQINAPGTEEVFFRCGISTAGEALETYGSAVLLCEMQRLAPAFCTLSIAYGTTTVVSGL